MEGSKYIGLPASVSLLRSGRAVINACESKTMSGSSREVRDGVEQDTEEETCINHGLVGLCASPFPSPLSSHERDITVFSPGDGRGRKRKAKTSQRRREKGGWEEAFPSISSLWIGRAIS